MPGPEVRPFRRSDRDQVTALINTHAQVALPGVALSVNSVLSQLEREPAEFIVDPWVQDRTTLVVSQRDRIVAAAHLLRYRSNKSVPSDYRGLSEVRWFVCAPDAPFWPDASAAGRRLLETAVNWLQASGAERIGADFALPAPGVFGLPGCWPHIQRIMREVGFLPGPRREPGPRQSPIRC